MQFTCPTCNQRMQCPDSFMGQKARCPNCGQKVLIPEPPAPPPLSAAGNKTVLAKLDDIPQASAQSPAKLSAVPSVIPVLIVSQAAEPVGDSKRRNRDDEDDTPRRRRRRRDEDDEDDDFDDGPRRRRRRQACPECGSTARPRQTTKFGSTSIIMLVIGIFFWPLLIVAFFVQEKWNVCVDCGEMLEQTGTGI